MSPIETLVKLSFFPGNFPQFARCPTFSSECDQWVTLNNWVRCPIEGLVGLYQLIMLYPSIDVHFPWEKNDEASNEHQ